MNLHKWMGVDGDGSHLNLVELEDEAGKTKFEPQRIRTYLITYI